MCSMARRGRGRPYLGRQRGRRPRSSPGHGPPSGTPAPSGSVPPSGASLPSGCRCTIVPACRFGLARSPSAATSFGNVRLGRWATWGHDLLNARDTPPPAWPPPPLRPSSSVGSNEMPGLVPISSSSSDGMPALVSSSSDDDGPPPLLPASPWGSDEEPPSPTSTEATCEPHPPRPWSRYRVWAEESSSEASARSLVGHTGETTSEQSFDDRHETFTEDIEEVD